MQNNNNILEMYDFFNINENNFEYSKKIEQELEKEYTKLDKIKEDLQIHLHKEISKITNRTANLVFYDVTNYYFETDSIEKLQHKAKYDELSQEKLEKEMRRKGPSKEHRPEPIIQLGLFMDTNGIPIRPKAVMKAIF